MVKQIWLDWQIIKENIGICNEYVLFSLIYFTDVYLIYNIVLVSGVQQSDLVIYIYVYILFHILFHYGLLQDTEYSSLCYTVGPCCLSILNVIVCIY